MVGGVTDRHWFEDRDERLDAAALTGAQEVSRKGFSQPSRLFFFLLSYFHQTNSEALLSEKHLGPVLPSQSGHFFHFSPNYHYGQFVLSFSLHCSHCEN